MMNRISVILSLCGQASSYLLELAVNTVVLCCLCHKQGLFSERIENFDFLTDLYDSSVLSKGQQCTKSILLHASLHKAITTYAPRKYEKKTVGNLLLIVHRHSLADLAPIFSPSYLLLFVECTLFVISYRTNTILSSIKEKFEIIGIKSSFHSQLNNIGYSFFCSSQSVANFSGSITANWVFSVSAVHTAVQIQGYYYSNTNVPQRVLSKVIVQCSVLC